MTAASDDPIQIQPFVDLLDDMIKNVLNDKNNMITFGDVYPTLARIVLWFKWENKTVISKATHEPAVYTTKSKAVLMTNVLCRMVDCYAEHAYKLKAAGITLYAATVEPHTSQLRMEFIFNPAHIADDFFKQLAHDRTLKRLHYEEERAHWEQQKPEVLEECLGKVKKLIERGGGT